jgi:hypothetical protein
MIPAVRHLVGRQPDVSRLLAEPFGKLSAHHRPVGRGVPGADAINNPSVYYGIPGASGPATRGRMATVTTVLLPGPVGIKFHRQVSEADPVATIRRNPGTSLLTDFTIRVPTAGPYPPENYEADGVTPKLSDSNIYLYPRDGGRRDVGDLLFQGRLINEKTATLRRQYGLAALDTGNPFDGWNQGTSAGRMRWPSSMLRFVELLPEDPGPIRHCLHILATRRAVSADRHILGKNWVWPAYGRDGSAGAADENLGDIPYGTRFVIRWIDRNLRSSLDLSPRGLRLFDCLLHYGFYVVDGTPEGGVDGGSSITFRTDQGSGTRGEWPEPMRSDVLNALKKLVPLCWPVRSVRPLDRETELWTDGMAYASGGGPLYPDTACTAWDA